MSAAIAAEPRPHGDLLERLRQGIAAEPGGVLEEIARREGASYREVLDALPDGQAIAKPGSAFEEVWATLAEWPGEITFIVHTGDGVFETRGRVPPGKAGRGFFNIHGETPIGGHIRADRCAAIYFVDRPFFGRRSCSVQFVNQEGEAMFKIFVGRDAARELDARQVSLFEAATRSGEP
ncbi:heme utilization cystosolic carrier protein HutX [uncultured Enterovirga sp.]|uniref:heme utilization cystosolic carrier protein HutX n=1 Tax=uncultured Enterovirga sp. TaxID=2026352 RepID=UPI0035C99582